MRATRRHPVVRLGADGSRRRRSDTLAGEEPLEIRVGGVSLSVTMRTPGDDVDLALGFLLSEGVLCSPDQVATVGYGPGVEADGTRSYNLLEVTLAAGVPAPDLSLERRVYTSSSCGICGTSSIEAVRKTTRFAVATDVLRIPLAEVLSLPDRLRERQGVFDRTGGVHAAALFQVDDDGPAELLCVREDVGRHNAVDKVLGWALRTNRLPARRCVLQLSGRASFELVQKAQMAGVPVLAAVSAPSALAVDLAAEAGMTLMGFSRGDSVNVYTGGDRVVG